MEASKRTYDADPESFEQNLVAIISAEYKLLTLSWKRILCELREIRFLLQH